MSETERENSRKRDCLCKKQGDCGRERKRACESVSAKTRDRLRL